MIDNSTYNKNTSQQKVIQKKKEKIFKKNVKRAIRILLFSPCNFVTYVPIDNGKTFDALFIKTENLKLELMICIPVDSIG